MKLCVYCTEQRVEICRLAELSNQRPVTPQSLQEMLQSVRGRQQEGFWAKRREISFIEEVREEIGFRFNLGCQALNELAIMFTLATLDDDDYLATFRGEFLLEGQVDLFRFHVWANKPVTVHIQLEKVCGVEQTQE